MLNMYAYTVRDMILSSLWQSAGQTTPPPTTIDQVNTYPTYNNAKIFYNNDQENFPIIAPRDFRDKPKPISQAPSN